MSDEGPESVLEGVTVTNGYVEWPDWGGAVRGSGSGPTLINCIFFNSSAYEGGGVDSTSGASPTLIGCTLSGNSSTGYIAGGGGLVSTWSIGMIANCTFYGNSAALLAVYGTTCP